MYLFIKRLADIFCMADDLATTWLDTKLGFATHKTRTKTIENLSRGEIEILKSQKSLYSEALSDNSKFECHRYATDGLVGAKVEQIRSLCGYLCKIDDSYIKPGINDFSLVHSAYRNTINLWLGPAAYINHDCHSNCTIYSVNDRLACVKVTKTIQPGEEITVNYATSYFNPDECQCVTCEKNGTGSFSSCQVPVIFHNIKCIVIHEYNKCYFCNMFLHASQKLFECHICGHKTSYKSWLARHIAGHMGHNYSCSLCDRTYSTKFALRRHEYYHLGNNSFTCDLCHRRFTRKDTLALHMRTHSGTEYVVKCPECPKTFKHNHDLGYHKNRAHTLAKPYACDVCGEAFHAPTNVYKHMKRVH